MMGAPALLKQIQKGALKPVPILCIFGEEPLYLRRLQDAWRHWMRSLGYDQRERFEMDGQAASWQALRASVQAGGLFSTLRLIEVDLPQGNPGKEGGQWIQQWCQAPLVDPQTGYPEIAVLLRCDRLDWRQQKSKWFQAIAHHGITAQSRPIEGATLIRWCRDRAQAAGLVFDESAATALAERVEGNLLAADQEIEKLALYFDQGAQISVSDVTQTIADQAHYQLFALSQTMLMGQAKQALHILTRLKQAGIEAPVVLWLLAKEARTLDAVVTLQSQMPLNQAFKKLNVWSTRQNELKSALGRHPPTFWRGLMQQTLLIDQAIKGQSPQSPWLLLSQWVAQVAQPNEAQSRLML